MIRNRTRLGASLLAASALSLSILAVGAAPGAGASSARAVPGVTSTSVTIGATVPLSGIASVYKSVSAAALSVFQYVDHVHKGINNRMVNYIRLDDCYNLAAFGLGCTQPTSTTTLSQTQVLVGTDHVFATVGALGTAAQDSVRNYMKTTGTPQLFVNSGSSDWNNPTTYPGLFGFQASYKVEGKIFAQYINKTWKGQKVGFIGQNDDFGANGYTGLTESTIAADKVTVAANDKFLYNPLDAVAGTSDIPPAIAKDKADGVKVMVLDSIPPVTKAILAAAHNASFAPHWVISSVGSNPLNVNSPYEKGAITFGSLPQTTDTSNVWNTWLRHVFSQSYSALPGYSATKPLDPNWQYGAAFAVAFLEALKTTGASPTQAGIIAAMKTTAFATPGIATLKYSATNHQGLNAGLMAVVASSTTISEPTHTVYTTTDAAASTITTVPYKVAAIPTYIK
jgi:ABC-type branched-subunit amino acid transport system substrate-binding protein